MSNNRTVAVGQRHGAGGWLMGGSLKSTVRKTILVALETLLPVHLRACAFLPSACHWTATGRPPNGPGRHRSMPEKSSGRCNTFSLSLRVRCAACKNGTAAPRLQRVSRDATCGICCIQVATQCHLGILDLSLRLCQKNRVLLHRS